MTERDLPLHDEAEARAAWRGGETILKGRGGESGPASEIDEAAQGGDGDEPGGAAPKGLAERPPD